MSHDPIPITRIISPSPTTSEKGGKDGYFPPQTRSQSHRLSSVESIKEHAEGHEENDPELFRARRRSRSPQIGRKSLTMTANGGISTGANAGTSAASATRPVKRKSETVHTTNGLSKGESNGFLSPASAYPQGFGSSYWRNLSRSPSPLGLIPIHREWRDFVHKHEVPRKALHVSIGFLTLWLYYEGVQKNQIHPPLLGLLIPIFAVDVIRFRWPKFNQVYIRILGPFMRESEAHDRFNGVISYLGGLWATMYFCRKDVAVMSVLLLSWCDTAASTFGRLWGKYTPRIRKGKSLAGSLAAFTFGLASAGLFWGLIAPTTPKRLNQGENSFAFTGVLMLPPQLQESLGLSNSDIRISGTIALSVMAIVSGLVASVSEAIDIFGLDDNLTIPILSGLGLSVFLWAFGDS